MSFAVREKAGCRIEESVCETRRAVNLMVWPGARTVLVCEMEEIFVLMCCTVDQELEWAADPKLELVDDFVRETA